MVMTILEHLRSEPIEYKDIQRFLDLVKQSSQKTSFGFKAHLMDVPLPRPSSFSVTFNMSSAMNSCELEIGKIIMSSFVKSHEQDVTKSAASASLASQLPGPGPTPSPGPQGGWGGARAGELGGETAAVAVFDDFEEDFEEAERRFGPLCRFAKKKEQQKRNTTTSRPLSDFPDDCRFAKKKEQKQKRNTDFSRRLHPDQRDHYIQSRTKNHEQHFRHMLFA
eukprot:gene12241-2876_t